MTHPQRLVRQTVFRRVGVLKILVILTVKRGDFATQDTVRSIRPLMALNPEIVN